MSQLLINDYLKQLDLIKKVGGSGRETILREAFKDLLKAWGKQHDLIFLAEYPLKTATKSNIAVDGVLLHELRMPLGYWEAKDADDDLDEEVSKKFKKGYPQDNIIFTDDVTAVLWQNRNEVLRCDMTDTHALAKLLKLFFSFERPEIANFRSAVEQFKTDLPAVLQALREMIEHEHQSNASFRKAEQKFLVHAQEAINPNLTDADVREMLIQHILTEEIFAKVFDDSEFHRHNNVARELYALEDEFFTGSLKKQTLKGLETYYAAIRSAAAQIGSHHEKQTFLKVIYENFYKVYNPKAADRLGVVYTPNEIVRFMIDGADWLTEKHFGKNLIDKDVEILDPATGTGTFISELLEHFRGQPAKLKYKYLNELYANEVAILPYYVANLNIESTYAAISGNYEEFPNLCFVDTLDNVGMHTSAHGTTANLFGSVSEENVARIKRQNSKKISVIIGNPPYNANQANENDNNKNRAYPEIDKRIKYTYIAESIAQKTKRYDMYSRFFRWASDRLGDQGIIAFITNRNFIDAKEADGLRRVWAEEFNEVYVIDLGGDIRQSVDEAKANVFGIKIGVAITFLIRKKGKYPFHLSYLRINQPTTEERLTWLSKTKFADIPFDVIKPDSKANWIETVNNDFNDYIAICSKQTKSARTKSLEDALFKTFSLGMSTNRDEWVVDFAAKPILERMKLFVSRFNNVKIAQLSTDQSVKWSRNLKRRFLQKRREDVCDGQLRPFLYRPFVRKLIYDSTLYVDERGGIDAIFPRSIPQDNKCILLTFGARGHFAVFAANEAVSLDFFVPNAACLVPLLQYSNDHSGENITSKGLKQFKEQYRNAVGKGRKITEEDIFHYCYAVLHDPLYREKYMLNLKRAFPRIPFYQDFWKWAAWGEELMHLHIGYESVVRFELKRIDIPDKKVRAAGLQPKAILRADKATGIITLDSETTLRGIPPEAWDYKLGNRCALEWVLDQYKEKKPKDPTIREKFDTYRFADYKDNVIDLLMRVTTVSVETERITQAMKVARR